MFGLKGCLEQKTKLMLVKRIKLFKQRAKPFLKLKINAKRYTKFVITHSLFLMLFLRTSDIKQD